jgi:chromosome partitioning protein
MIYSISMNKGGVGKTSFVTNMAGAIVTKLKKKVLIIDLDGQGNISVAFGLNPNNFKKTTYDVLLNKVEINDCVVKFSDLLHICPSNDSLNFFDFDVLTKLKKYPNYFGLLKEKVNKIKGDYDYIFLDTPPNLGLIQGNALVCADKVIIPFTPEKFATQGLMRMIEVVEEFKMSQNKGLSIFGVVGMMVDSRTVLHAEMLQMTRKYCVSNNMKLYETVIPRSIRFANSTAYDFKPATMIDTNNAIVQAYYELMEEMFDVK